MSFVKRSRNWIAVAATVIAVLAGTGQAEAAGKAGVGSLWRWIEVQLWWNMTPAAAEPLKAGPTATPSGGGTPVCVRPTAQTSTGAPTSTAPTSGQNSQGGCVDPDG